MKPMEEFEIEVVNKMNELQRIEEARKEEKYKQDQKTSEAFAESVIQLLALELRDFTEFGERVISHQVKLLARSDYIVDPKDRFKSYIEVDEKGATIHLKYPYEQKYNPFLVELNQEIVDEILRPYCISVTALMGYENVSGDLVISYDHTKRKEKELSEIEEKERGVTL